MKRIVISVMAVVLLLGFAGCGDDVKTVKKTEMHHESQPVPVSPGEPIVE